MKTVSKDRSGRGCHVCGTDWLQLGRVQNEGKEITERTERTLTAANRILTMYS